MPLGCVSFCRWQLSVSVALLGTPDSPCTPVPPWLLAPALLHTPHLHPQFSCTDHTLHPPVPQDLCIPVPCISPTQHCPHCLHPSNTCTPSVLCTTVACTQTIPAPEPSLHHSSLHLNYHTHITWENRSEAKHSLQRHQSSYWPTTEENSSRMRSSLCPWSSYQSRVHFPQGWSSRSPLLTHRCSPSLRSQGPCWGLTTPAVPLAHPPLDATSPGQGAPMARGSSCRGCTYGR